jgi:hypothetical protein
MTACVAGRAQIPATQPATTPPAATQPAATRPAASQPTSAPKADQLDPKVDQSLTRLEARQVDDLRAAVSWTLHYIYDLPEDAITKKGELWYQQQKPVAKFLVQFNKKIASNRLREIDERHMFDGRWYTELQSETKTLTRREIRREGDPGNPYKLGEGPFPVPFGQKKADILREFEVTLVPEAAADPPTTDHLKLMPRTGTESGRNYKQVEVWIAREGPHAGLPIKVAASQRDSTGKVTSTITVTFDDVRLNQGFSGGVFKIEKPPGYSEPPPELLKPIEVPAGEDDQQPAP